VLVLLLALLASSATGRAAPLSTPVSAPVQALVSQARQLRLARSRVWLRLLHYRPDAKGNLVSQIRNKESFFAPNGAHDPEAELAATLQAFFAPVIAGHEDDHALCRFPARRRVLEERLHFEHALRMPECPALARFRSELDPEGVALVYVANYLDNPASAFGHTFIRLKRRRPPGATQTADALDYSVEYVAKTDTANPVWFAVKGLAGLFPGTYHFHHFASKLHEYADAEARDLWQYDLNLSQAEVELLTLHLWELSIANLDYYYMTKNCSYHALATLEAAAPRIDLLSHVDFVVVPRDTVRALYAVPGLVGDTYYRPSLRSQFRQQVSRLSSAQQDLAQRLTLDPRTPLPQSFTLAERVATLDAAVLVLDARFAHYAEDAADPRVEAARAVLSERRKRLSSAIPPPLMPAPLREKEPQRAHGSMRLTLGTGVTSQYGSSFSTLGYRVALHDLADPPDTDSELSQVQFLDTRLRYDLGQRSLTLDRLTFAELVALNPITRFEHALSWRGLAFGTRLHDRACPDCFAHGLDFSIGATRATEDERIALFVMADAFVAFDFEGRLDGIGGKSVRLGIGPYAGVRVRLPQDLIALLSATWSYLPFQTLHSTFDVRGTVRGALSRNVALGFEGAAQPQSREALFASYLYF
jgi:Domain of unknown function (DUF4105)